MDCFAPGRPMSERFLQLFVLVGLMVVSCCSHRRIVDLTHTLKTGRTVTYPGYPEFNHTVLIKGKQPTGVWMMSGWFAISEHAGTHIDAPAHFDKKGKGMNQVPLEDLIGPGVVIDIRGRAASDPDAQVELADIQDWETKNGRIPDGAIILMNSGWSDKYPNKTKIFGTPFHNDLYSTKYHHPGVKPEVCRWLLDHRNIKGLGSDTPSPDFGQAKYEDVHVMLQGAGKVILENVANLHNIPVSGATIFAIPTKLADSSGAPVRLFAVVGENPSVYNAAPGNMNYLTYCCTFLYAFYLWDK